MVTARLLLLVAGAAAFDRSKPALALRGGVVYSQPRYGQYQTERYGPASWQTQPNQSADEAKVDSSGEAMSDAELIHVKQQFQRPAVRLAFLRKVYGIVAVQLAMTTGIVALLRANPQILIALFSKLNVALFWLPMLPLMLLPQAARSGSQQYQYFLLALFTVFESIGVGAATMSFPLQLVLRAAGTTAIATAGLSMYALTTRRDFSIFGGMLSSMLLASIALGLMQRLFGGPPMLALQSFVGVAVFCGFLVVNTQMIMGGNKKRQLRPNEHIMGAVSIYTDIMGLFLNILASMRDER